MLKEVMAGGDCSVLPSEMYPCDMRRGAQKQEVMGVTVILGVGRMHTELEMRVDSSSLTIRVLLGTC